MWRCVSSSSGLRGGPPNSASNLLVRHRQAGAVVEVATGRAGTMPSSLRSISLSRIRSAILRLAVGREAHHLVLAGIDLEAGVVGEGRVEQARASAGSGSPCSISRLLPLPIADRRRRPLADAVHASARPPPRTATGRRRWRRGSGDARRTAARCCQSKSGAELLAARRAAGPSGTASPCSHTGIAMRNELKPRGAKAR